MSADFITFLDACLRLVTAVILLWVAIKNAERNDGGTGSKQ